MSSTEVHSKFVRRASNLWQHFFWILFEPSYFLILNQQMKKEMPFVHFAVAFVMDGFNNKIRGNNKPLMGYPFTY
jgi:hypothetical protein